MANVAGKVVEMRLMDVADDIDNETLRKTLSRNVLRTKIEQAHKKHKLENSKIESAKDFMTKVMYSVPLSKLYQVVASCQYNEGAEYCPVLVQIKDKDILKL